MALQPDGKIIAAGREDFYLAGGNMGIVRYLSDGTLDGDFGNGGLQTVQFKSSSEATGIALQADGKIILTGSTGNLYDTSYLAVARLHANGVIDSSFGANGLTETNIDGLDFGTACALQQDGKIILGGQDKSINIILARYNNDVQNKNPVARIRKWIEHHILHWQNMQSSNTFYYTVERSNNAISGFTQIAKVKSEERNSKSEIYTYVLPASATSSFQAANYYRINAVSSSGNVIASAIISDEETEDAKISIYPNPMQNVLHISGLNENVKYEIRITNEKGNVFAKASANKVNSYNLNIQNLHNGIYYAAIISSSGKPVLIKLIKE